ncbi:MAG: arylsulfatase, partial [Paracoccaceae bacterium]|nr:arylsulfatase [Paracoccaceae bacterium]
QFSHAIDIAPTILEAAGLPEPEVVNGTPQIPMAGTSLLYAFNNADALEQHTTQYFEMFGNRAMYRDGWFARTIHRAPWQTGKQKPLTEDVWELYNAREDFSLARDLAKTRPDKLAELQALFMEEARRYNVLPIDDRTLERVNAVVAGRPDILGGRKSLTLYPGMDGMLENNFINIKNASITITADVDIPEGGANGVIIAQGGRFGGWSLYMQDGKPIYTYNWLGLERYTVASDSQVPAGAANIVLDFAYDGDGPGKGGQATLIVGGKKVAESRIEKTHPVIFSTAETADVGLDNQTPVAEGIGFGPDETRFTGTIQKVVIDVK